MAAQTRELPSHAAALEAARSLASLPAGGAARVARVSAHPDDEARLMALGICIGRNIEIIKAGEPIIVRVVGTRVGLSARLAAGVIVEPLHAARRAAG